MILINIEQDERTSDEKQFLHMQDKNNKISLKNEFVTEKTTILSIQFLKSDDSSSQDSDPTVKVWIEKAKAFIRLRSQKVCHLGNLVRL